MPLQLWLVRHGESTFNKGRISDGQTAGLTALGHRQMLAVANAITVKPDLIITSSLIRAQESALPIQNKWPECPMTIWPIEEFNYLSPQKISNSTIQQRRFLIRHYWNQADPLFCDDNSESFSQFIHRIEVFHQQIQLQDGFIIAVSHGHFLKAYQLCLKYGFDSTVEGMRRYRQAELKAPIQNAQIIQLQFNH